MSRFLRGVAAIAAIGWIVLFLFLQASHIFKFYDTMGLDITKVIESVELWVRIIAIALIAMSAAVKKGLIVFIIACVFIAAVIILNFFPQVIDGILPG